MDLILEPLRLLHESVKNQWGGSAVYIIIKFDSHDDFSKAYRFFEETFGPRCFSTSGGILPEIVLNRRGIEELATLWNLKTENPTSKTHEISVQSRLEAIVQYLMLTT